MFEKYPPENLYFCQIEDWKAYGLQNFGGCISIDGDYKIYDTIVYKQNNEKYIDISYPNRTLNIIKTPSESMPRTSSNSHLYILVEESLKKYQSSEKVLERKHK